MTTMVQKKPTEVNVVCEQGEWEAMQREQPGLHALVRAGIGSEEEAEKFARGTTGDPQPRERSMKRKTN
jgi:hypothetical protein